MKLRLYSHNKGEAIHTNKYKPWKIVWCCWFEKEDDANRFELYLKTGSGIAFRYKHLTPK